MCTGIFLVGFSRIDQCLWILFSSLLQVGHSYSVVFRRMILAVQTIIEPTLQFPPPQIFLGFPAVPNPLLSMLGGACWCTGNLLAVPVIRRIGLALGLCVWNVANMLVGWGSGFFGILGATKNEIRVPWINCVGAMCAAVGCVFYMFIQPAEDEEEGPVSMM